MASEAPDDQGKWPDRPWLGLILGFLVVVPVLWVTLKNLRESEFVRQLDLLWDMSLGIIVLVGGGVGGTIQLLTQGRAAEIPRLLRLLLRGALWLVSVFGSLFLGGWIGERLFGTVGHYVGLWLACGVLLFLIWWWRARRSSSEKPPAPPPV